MTHGARTDGSRHVGDLGNLAADAAGKATISFEDSMINLSGRNSIMGRACVLHGGTDDLGKGEGEKVKGSKASGNAGPRIGCGVVGLIDASKVPAAAKAKPASTA